MEQFFIQNKQSSIVVGLETTFERMSELTPFSNPQYGGGKGDLYVDFIVNNVKPYIDARFRTKSDRDNTGIAGSSLGGLLSFYAGLKRQEIFGKVGVFSPSFFLFHFFYNCDSSSHLNIIITRKFR
jgi:predicted alpha/beta superfamily hydrolase